MDQIEVLTVIILLGIPLLVAWGAIFIEHPNNVKFCQSHGYKDYVINGTEFCLTDTNTLKTIIRTSNGEKIIVN